MSKKRNVVAITLSPDHRRALWASMLLYPCVDPSLSPDVDEQTLDMFWRMFSELDDDPHYWKIKFTPRDHRAICVFLAFASRYISGERDFLFLPVDDDTDQFLMEYAPHIPALLDIFHCS